MSIPCDDFDGFDDFDDYGDDMDNDMGLDDDYDSDDVWHNDDRMDDAECFARGYTDDDSYDVTDGHDQLEGKDPDTDSHSNIGAMGVMAASVIGAGALLRHRGNKGGAVNDQESSIKNHSPEPVKRHFTTLERFLMVIVVILLIFLLTYIITGCNGMAV